MTTTDYDSPTGSPPTAGTVFLSGVQALARLPIEQLRADRRAGLRTAAFVSGLPGVPARRLRRHRRARRRSWRPDLPIVCRPAVNEEYAATAVMGSQLAVRAARLPLRRRRRHLVRQGPGRRPRHRRPPPRGVRRHVDARRRGRARRRRPEREELDAAVVVGRACSTTSTCRCSTPAIRQRCSTSAGTRSRCRGRADSGPRSRSSPTSPTAPRRSSLDPDRVRPVLPDVAGLGYAPLPRAACSRRSRLDLEREIYEVRYLLADGVRGANRLNRVIADAPDAWIGIVASGITLPGGARGVPPARARRTRPRSARSGSACSSCRCRCRSIPTPCASSRADSTRSS